METTKVNATLATDEELADEWNALTDEERADIKALEAMANPTDTHLQKHLGATWCGEKVGTAVFHMSNGATCPVCLNNALDAKIIPCRADDGRAHQGNPVPATLIFTDEEGYKTPLCQECAVAGGVAE